MLDETEFFADITDWEEREFVGSDEWTTYYDSCTQAAQQAHSGKKQNHTSKQEQLEQDVYLKRLEVAARRLARQQKKQRKTFAQALKNTHSTGNNTNGNDKNTELEKEDQQLLKDKNDRSHPIAIDIEMSSLRGNATPCSLCKECCNKSSCVVS
jgi:hypothetical protein